MSICEQFFIIRRDRPHSELSTKIGVILMREVDLGSGRGRSVFLGRIFEDGVIHEILFRDLGSGGLFKLAHESLIELQRLSVA